MSELDEVTFDETIGLEIQGWIVNLEGVQMYKALSELELIASGTPFAKSDRLYRRLSGDYTQAAFARTSGEEDETEAIIRRDEKLSEFINRVTFTERTINELIARKNATRRLLSAQVRYSSTPNSVTETNLQHQDMSLTGTANANDVPLSSEQSQGAEQGQTEGLPALAPNDDGGKAAGYCQALASGGFPSSATTALGDWYGTTTIVTSTIAVANTQSTRPANDVRRSVFTTRINH